MVLQFFPFYFLTKLPQLDNKHCPNLNVQALGSKGTATQSKGESFTITGRILDPLHVNVESLHSGEISFDAFKKKYKVTEHQGGAEQAFDAHSKPPYTPAKVVDLIRVMFFIRVARDAEMAIIDSNPIGCPSIPLDPNQRSQVNRKSRKVSLQIRLEYLTFSK